MTTKYIWFADDEFSFRDMQTSIKETTKTAKDMANKRGVPVVIAQAVGVVLPDALETMDGLPVLKS